MKVEELNYNLRNIDSNLENQVYYSNTSLPTATTLAQVTVAGASNQAIVRKKFDDPTTTEDESTQEKDKLFFTKKTIVIIPKEIPLNYLSMVFTLTNMRLPTRM